jgi:hypothetical protein
MAVEAQRAKIAFVHQFDPDIIFRQFATSIRMVLRCYDNCLCASDMEANHQPYVHLGKQHYFLVRVHPSS